MMGAATMASLALRRPAASPLRRQETRAGLLFILPWLIALLVFSAYPVLATFYLSFTDYNILQPPSWIGLDNYQKIFADDTAFWTAARNSAVYALISVPLKIVIAFGLAMLLNMGVRGIGVYRTVFYLPTLVPPIAATIVFILLFSPVGGPINTILSWVGISAPDWFNDPNWAMPALIVLGIWPLGVETLAFLAGLKEIPQDLLDAASIDGAVGWQRLRHVILPLISPVILFNLVIGVIYSFQVFTQALVIGGQNGSPLESTLMFLVLIYRNAFRYFAMGYAAALSVILFVVVLLLTLLIFRTARSWVHYEGGQR
jgi:multiple sugar transport system permease protein